MASSTVFVMLSLLRTAGALADACESDIGGESTSLLQSKMLKGAGLESGSSNKSLTSNPLSGDRRQVGYSRNVAYKLGHWLWVYVRTSDHSHWAGTRTGAWVEFLYNGEPSNYYYTPSYEDLTYEDHKDFPDILDAGASYTIGGFGAGFGRDGTGARGARSELPSHVRIGAGGGDGWAFTDIEVIPYKAFTVSAPPMPLGIVVYDGSYEYVDQVHASFPSHMDFRIPWPECEIIVTDQDAPHYQDFTFKLISNGDQDTTDALQSSGCWHGLDDEDERPRSCGSDSVVAQWKWDPYDAHQTATESLTWYSGSSRQLRKSLRLAAIPDELRITTRESLSRRQTWALESISMTCHVEGAGNLPTINFLSSSDGAQLPDDDDKSEVRMRIAARHAQILRGEGVTDAHEVSYHAYERNRRR